MKKILIVLLVAGLVSSCCSAFAAGVPNRFNQDQKIKMYVKVNTSATAYDREYLSSSSAGILVPGVHRILGYSITANRTSPFESTCAIYDSTDQALTAGLGVTALEAEAELPAGTGGNFVMWFPYPYEIQSGVVASVGPGTTFTIYYEDYRR